MFMPATLFALRLADSLKGPGFPPSCCEEHSLGMPLPWGWVTHVGLLREVRAAIHTLRRPSRPFVINVIGSHSPGVELPNKPRLSRFSTHVLEPTYYADLHHFMEAKRGSSRNEGAMYSTLPGSERASGRFFDSDHCPYDGDGACREHAPNNYACGI